MEKIIKRNGKEAEFDLSRIITAITNAMRETERGEDKELAFTIAEEIKEESQHYTSPLHVEEIQDMVEYKLSKSDRYDVARAYAVYREDRARKREKRPKSNGLLTDEFISKYKHRKPPFTQLGEFVYYRTYSRWIESEERRERWFETVRRAVEYNCSLIPNTTYQEAEELYDNIFNLRQFLSGRTFWVGGTEVSKNFPLGNFNCSAQVIDDFEAFRDLFYLLLVGSGVGFRVLKEDVVKLPPVRTDMEVINLHYTPVPKNQRQESTSIKFEDEMVEIVVGDSKEGKNLPLIAVML